MKTSHGSGNDGIPSYFSKIDFPIIKQSLCYLFDLSLFSSKFPESWKIARVAPIFKSGQRNDRTNYRPIYVLTFISRLFEKLLYNQSYDYLDTNKLLYSLVLDLYIQSLLFSWRTLTTGILISMKENILV